MWEMVAKLVRRLLGMDPPPPSPTFNIVINNGHPSPAVCQPTTVDRQTHQPAASAADENRRGAPPLPVSANAADGDAPKPPWPVPPVAERKPVWFRGRVYRYVKFGGKNSRIETLNGALDPLEELRDDRGTVSNTGTISNSRLFNDRQGLRPITHSDHP